MPWLSSNCPTELPCRRDLVARKKRTSLTAVVFVLVAVVVMSMPMHPRANAQRASDLVTEDVSFRSSDGVTLRGTIVAPADHSDEMPGLVLVHGGGPATRDWHRQEAEAFARAGIVTLIYDKRTDGYSLTERSYAQLADDALAAHEVLGSDGDVDGARVGLWGVSEGGWVVPLAASNSDDVAFLITVGANGIPPAQQEAWAKSNRLRRVGVSGSMLHSYTTTALRTLVAAGLFPEGDYDPIPVLESLSQPVLGIWGAYEQVSPPAENLSIFAEALERGSAGFTLRILAEGDHAAYVSPDGGFATEDWISTGGVFAPGYIELVASWVHGLSTGPSTSSAATPPEQETTSTPLPPLDWYETIPLQVAVVGLIVFAFTGYLLSALIRRFRGQPQTHPAARTGFWVATTGLVTVFGLLGYFGIMLITSETVVGPVVLGRTIPWITLQLLALGVVVGAVVTSVKWWRYRGHAHSNGTVLLGLSTTAAALFVPWALYWGLLLP